MSGKNNFAQACSFLSQMVKEKRSFDEHLAINSHRSSIPTTLSLLPGVDVPVGTDINGTGTEKSPLTIFYNGKVVVFDDFPKEKAKDLMQLATDGRLPPAPRKLNEADNADLLAQTRRASLHRFLNKRKERINAKAPYQIKSSGKMKIETHHEETRSWLGLGH